MRLLEFGGEGVRTGAFSFRAGKRSRKGSLSPLLLLERALGVLFVFVDVAAADNSTNKDQPTHRCHSEPAPYGWAVRRISQLAEMVQEYAVNEKRLCSPSRGRSSLPLAGASEPPAGVRMTHAGVGRDGIK